MGSSAIPPACQRFAQRPHAGIATVPEYHLRAGEEPNVGEAVGPGAASVERSTDADARPLADVGLGHDLSWELLDAAPDGIVMTDENGQMLLVNRQTEAIFGYDRAELLGRPVEDLLPERVRQVHRAHRTRYRAEPRTRAMGGELKLEGRRKDGSVFPVEVSLSPFRSGSQLFVVAAVRDVTTREAADAELRRVHHLLDATRDAVFIFEWDTLRFSYVNDGAAEQVGYPKQDLLDMTMLHIAPEFTEDELRNRLSPLNEGTVTSTMFATVHRRRDGTDVPVEVVVQTGTDEASSSRSFIAVVRDIGDRVEAEERLREASEELRLVEDRERIGRDLHDIVVQRLFAAGMSLHALSSLVADRPDVATRVNDVVDELDTTIREIRTAIYGLQSSKPTSGLRSEVLRIIDEARDALATEPRVRFDGLLDIVPDNVAEHVLATLRESLSNVARHAAAANVEVDLAASDGRLTLTVIDDGIGIPDEPEAGNGLVNLASRAEELGGTFVIRHRVGGGTILEWSVPTT
jgi:PAS domain S-box-containing protein